MLILTLGLIFLFALVLSYTVVATKIEKISLNEGKLREALWARHARIPLLLALVVPNDDTQRATFSHMLALRDTLTNEHMPLTERITHEKRMTHLLREMLIHGETDVVESKNPHFIALKREFEAIHNDINRVINEYNFFIGSFAAMNRLPWFKIWSFFSKKDQTTLLEAV